MAERKRAGQEPSQEREKSDEGHEGHHAHQDDSVDDLQSILRSIERQRQGTSVDRGLSMRGSDMVSTSSVSSSRHTPASEVEQIEMYMAD